MKTIIEITADTIKESHCHSPWKCALAIAINKGCDVIPDQLNSGIHVNSGAHVSYQRIIVPTNKTRPELDNKNPMYKVMANFNISEDLRYWLESYDYRKRLAQPTKVKFDTEKGLAELVA